MKKRVVIIVAIGLVLAAVAAGATWYVVSTQVVKKDGPATATEPLSPYKQAAKTGMDAEKEGKAKEALTAYKKARTLCNEGDASCKTNMDMKVYLMELAVKQEGKKPAKKPSTSPEGIRTQAKD